MKFLKDIPASTFTISAVTIGFLLIDDSTPSEQNSLGNWFMMIGQVLCTNASQQQVINNYLTGQGGAGPHIVNDANNTNNPNDTNSQIQMMQKTIDAMNQEIQHLKGL